jgi:hypothetical protein
MGGLSHGLDSYLLANLPGQFGVTRFWIMVKSSSGKSLQNSSATAR